MQTARGTTPANPSARPAPPTLKDTVTPPMAGALAQYQIMRRNGAVVAFEPTKIAVAMMKAFLAVHGTQGAASASVREVVEELTQGVVRALMRSRPARRHRSHCSARPGAARARKRGAGRAGSAWATGTF